MTWTGLRIVAVAAGVEAVWIAGVVVAALYVPALTATPGMVGQIGTGPTLRAQLLASTGLVGGLVVGVLLSRVPLGYHWDRVGYSWFNAGYYAALASFVGTSVTFTALTVVQIVRIWAEMQVVAPLLIGVVTFTRLGGFVFLGVVGGFVAGASCFLLGNTVSVVVDSQ